jgi:hypothetical protein
LLFGFVYFIYYFRLLFLRLEICPSSSLTSRLHCLAVPATMPGIPSSDIPSFQTHLHSSTRILALLGAGLSASSGLGTFRGAGGYWRNHRAEVLATPQAFARDPGLVWQFYAYRRHLALKAKPNPGHYALAELARQKGDFVTLTQNVDGMSSACTKGVSTH